ncbi:MAG TPA: glycosyltransferase family 4 protein [Ignavibacteriaceae bacterium]|nr:glycosyltransferase family 4 protein [Ignavibacteriaceae bacterium]
MTKKKVVIIDSNIVNDYSLCLGQGIINNNSDVIIIVPENRLDNGFEDVKMLKWLPSKNRKVSKLYKIYAYLKYISKFIGLIFKYKPDAIHFEFFRFKSDFLLFPLLRLMKPKLVYTAHNIYPHERNKSDYFLHKIVYSAAEEIIVHSNFIKKRLIASFPVNEKKVKVIAHGNFDHYLPEHLSNKCDARKLLGISQNENVALFFGYIREYKGVDLLLEAFKIIKEKNIKIKLLLAGAPYSDNLKREYLQMIEDYKLKDIISYKLDFIKNEEIQNYFLAADLVVLPYKNIDHSGIVHLAFSFAKPIAASDVGDFSETIIDGRTGFIFKNNSPEDIAGTIFHAFENKQKLEEMGLQAKMDSDTLYSWKEIGKKTLELY